MTLVTEVFSETDAKMRRTLEVMGRDLSGIRTGRASTGLVDRISVDYHGVATPLNQLANVSAPESRLLVIQPWDRTAISAIEKAILKSDIGLMPSNDGRVIRLAIPHLTEERRRDLVKLVRRRVEEGRVAIRNCRREALDLLKKLEKEKAISEDELHRSQEQLRKLTDAMIEEVDRQGAKKEEEVMEV